MGVTSRRARRVVLVVHVVTAGWWLGLLTAAVLDPGPGLRVAVASGVAGGVNLASGAVLARGMTRLSWVRVKGVLGALIVALAVATVAWHVPGPLAVVARSAGVLILITATVVGVTKPRGPRGRHVRIPPNGFTPRTDRSVAGGAGTAGC